MGLDLKAWLDDLQKAGSLTDEERKQAEAILTKEGVSQEVKDAFERQSDYSRRMAELQKQKAEEDEYAARLAAWESGVKEKLTSLEEEAKRYKSAYYTVAASNGLDPSEVEKVVVPKESVEKKPEPTGDVLTKKDADQYGANIMRINAKLIALNTEHQRLFGKPMERIDEFVDTALQAGEKIEDTFRNFYKVADREKELNEEAVQARIKSAIAEERQKWTAESSDPFGSNGPRRRPVEQMSPVFALQEEGSVPGDHAQHRARVDEVVQAWHKQQQVNEA